MVKRVNKPKGLRSGFEGTIQDSLKDKKIKFEYEPIRLKYISEAFYLPDFVVNGTIYLEVKGYFKPADRKKMKEVKACHPSLDIRLVFQRDNYLTKAKAMTYSQWATKHGFQWAVGEIPKEWLKEFKK